MKGYIVTLLAAALTSPMFAATTIDQVNRYAYGANIGWIDASADGSNGAIIGDYYCMGYLYAANVGWINLGSGIPANGIQYQNNSAGDFGVNHDGLGNLYGYAWAANIGWINFENFGAPKVDLQTGVLSGYIWSANCGWISLSNAVAYVQTNAFWPGPPAPNGLPIPWLLSYFRYIDIDANADPTGKGMTIKDDYEAGTDPNDVQSVFRITAMSVDSDSGRAIVSLTWDSVPTRLYRIWTNPDLETSNWLDSGLGLISPSAGTSTNYDFMDTGESKNFYRVEALLPLRP